MQVEYVESYKKLSDLKPGQVAVSKDRKSFFACGWFRDENTHKFSKVILDMNNLSNQYPDHIDMNQPIRVLQTGDRYFWEQ